MSQITEKVFRKSLNKYKPYLWFIKLQVLPMTFTKSPADYIVLADNHRYLIECKEVDCRITNKTFAFSRITQLRDLIDFENYHVKNRSYLLIMFRQRMLKDSHAFMIPIKEFLKFKKVINKKSGNLNDFTKYFGDYKISTKKSFFNLGRWFD